MAQRYFSRYDLDGSGNLNNPEEFSCLVTNLVHSLSIDVTLDQIDALTESACESIDDGNSLDFDAFVDFFQVMLHRLQQDSAVDGRAPQVDAHEGHRRSTMWVM